MDGEAREVELKFRLDPGQGRLILNLAGPRRRTGRPQASVYLFRYAASGAA